MAEEKVHIDAASGQAAWYLTQVLTLMLVQNKTLPKKEVQQRLAETMRHLRTSPGLNPAQRAAGVLLNEFAQTYLHTADKSDGH